MERPLLLVPCAAPLLLAHPPVVDSSSPLVPAPAAGVNWELGMRFRPFTAASPAVLNIFDGGSASPRRRLVRNSLTLSLHSSLPISDPDPHMHRHTTDGASGSKG